MGIMERLVLQTMSKPRMVRCPAMFLHMVFTPFVDEADRHGDIDISEDLVWIRSIRQQGTSQPFPSRSSIAKALQNCTNGCVLMA